MQSTCARSARLPRVSRAAVGMGAALVAMRSRCVRVTCVSSPRRPGPAVLSGSACQLSRCQSRTRHMLRTCDCTRPRAPGRTGRRPLKTRGLRPRFGVWGHLSVFQDSTRSLFDRTFDICQKAGERQSDRVTDTEHVKPSSDHATPSPTARRSHTWTTSDKYTPHANERTAPPGRPRSPLPLVRRTVPEG